MTTKEKNFQDPGKALVYKHHDLNAARYSLSELEQKIVLAHAALIKKTDTDFETKVIPVPELARLIQYKHLPSLRRELFNIGVSIMKKPIAIPTGKGKDSFVIYNWFSKIEFNADTDSLILRSDPDLKPYLLNLQDRFLEGGGGRVLIYRLSAVVNIKGKFNIRVYELCKQYLAIGKVTVELSELRLKIGLDEHASDPRKVVKKKYKNYADFKKRILIPAQTQLAERTDIKFTFREIKVGRAVGKIEFTISSNKKVVRLPDEIVALIPEKQLPDCVGICIKIFKEQGLEALKFYVLQTIEADKKEKRKSWGATIHAAYKRNDFQATRERGEENSEEKSKAFEEAVNEEKKKALAEIEKRAQVEELRRLRQELIIQMSAEEMEAYREWILSRSKPGKKITDGTLIANLFPYWEERQASCSWAPEVEKNLFDPV